MDIHFSWLVIFVLILWSLSAGYFPGAYPGHRKLAYWVGGFAATVMLFGSVLIHELSHAAVGNLKGEKIDRITLFIFGGIAHLTGELRNANDEILIAGAGPPNESRARSVLLAHLQGDHGRVSRIVMDRGLSLPRLHQPCAGCVQLCYQIPLDGGRLFRAILWKRSGDIDQATARAVEWGTALAWGMMALGGLEIFSGALVGGIWLIFIGLFLRSAAISSYQGTIIGHLLQHIRVGDIMTRDPVTVASGYAGSGRGRAILLEVRFGGFPVVADGRAIGALSLSQVRNCCRIVHIRRSPTSCGRWIRLSRSLLKLARWMP